MSLSRFGGLRPWATSFFSNLLRLTTFSVFQEDGHDSPSRHRLFHSARFAGVARAGSASRRLELAARSINSGSCGPAFVLSRPMSAPLHRMVRWLQQLHLQSQRQVRCLHATLLFVARTAALPAMGVLNPKPAEPEPKRFAIVVAGAATWRGDNAGGAC